MNTFLKLLLIAALALSIAHFCPIALLPLAIVGLTMMAVGGILSGGLAAVLSVALTLAVILLAVVVTLLAATSPLWIPVLLLFGLISLFRRSAQKTA